MPIKTHPALEADFVKSILDYDPATGLFTWRHRPDMPRKWNSRYAGKRAGTVAKNGYVKIQIGKKNGNGIHYPAHVLAWLIIYGQWLPGEVDHIFGDRSDNRICMLRRAGRSDNNCNKARQRNNKSGHVGVWFVNQCQKWEAKINRGGVSLWRAHFSTLEEAVAARKAKIDDLHGEFAVKNPSRSRYYHGRDH